MKNNLLPEESRRAVMQPSTADAAGVSASISPDPPGDGCVRKRCSGTLILLLGFLPLSAMGQANDAFANRLRVTGLSLFGFPDSFAAGNTNATREAGEPDHAGNSGGKSLWWSWTAPADGVVTIDTMGSSFDTLLAVYTGASISNLLPIAADNDSGGNGASLLSFSAVAGTDYAIAVDGFNGASGSIALHIDQDPAAPGNDLFANRITITGLSNTVTGYTLGATTEPEEPKPPGFTPGQTIWWTWTAPTNGLVTIELVGSCPFNSVAAYVGDTLPTLQRVAGGYHGANLPARIQFPALAGTVFQVAAGGDVVFGGNVALTIRQTVARGRVVGRGQYSDGQLDAPANATNIVAVAAGYNHSLALRVDGTVVQWGSLSAGAVPSGLSNVVAIAAGPYESVALQIGGTVVAWGVSTAPTNATNAIAILGSGYALQADGTILNWGSAYPFPFYINPVAIAATYYGGLAVQTDGTVESWSRSGSSGRATNGPPPDLDEVIAVATFNNNMALRKDRTVVVWGDGLHTNGTPTADSILASNIIAIAAGSDPSFILLRADGTVYDGFAFFKTLTNATAVSASSYNFVLAVVDAPVNDNFVSRAPLSGTNVIVQAVNYGAGAEPGEPNHAVATGTPSKTNSVWYEWIAPASGGVVIDVTSSNIVTPILAVYTNSSLLSLGRVAECSSRFRRARVAFTAQAGVAYQVAIAAATEFGVNDGQFTLALQFSDPPPNDDFSDRTVIDDNFLEFDGSFVGATRETGEPSHGPRNLPETLWWTWTAPTNNGIGVHRVRIIADSTSLPPDIGVYRGTSVNALTNVAVRSITNGMTRVVEFNAASGEIFQIALAGRQHDPAGNIIAPEYGSYHLRFWNRYVTLSFPSNLVTLFSTNAFSSCSGGFVYQAISAQARVTNFGAAATGPLRVTLRAISGGSVQGNLSAPATMVCDLVTNAIVPSGLASNQTANATLTSALPAPVDQSLGDGEAGRGTGWGVYAALQEQVGSNWFTIDETLVNFGDWPTLGGGGAGPGGGVIRLDPGYLGLANNNPLTAVSILGPGMVPEGSRTNFTGQASFLLGETVTFTQTLWTASHFKITNGIFAAGSVTNDTAVMLTNFYSYSGLRYSGVTNVLVSNLPPPFLAGRLLSRTNLALTVTGVPGRSNRVEATTNINPPTTTWISLLTNAPANGVFTFTNLIQTNTPRRFFRVREME